MTSDNIGSLIPDPQSRIPNPASRIPHPESRIPHPESRACLSSRRALLRDGDDGVEVPLGLTVASKQQRIVRSSWNRVAVLPRKAVVDTPDRDTVDLVAPSVEDAKELGPAGVDLLLDVRREAV